MAEQWNTKRELELWGNSEEVRNVAFIRTLGETFVSRLLKYYNEGVTPDDRLTRIGDICETLRNTRFAVGSEEITLAAPLITSASTDEAKELGAGCLPGEKCINGICVPGRGSGG